MRQIDEIELFDVEVGRARVETGEFEQIHHHVVEPPHLADDDVERLLGAFGDVVAAGIEHLDGGRQGGDR